MSSALDRNLAELLRRHEPVAMDAGFRERLGARVRDEAARLAVARRAARAPAPRVARPAWIPALAAAASVCALLLAGWWLWHATPAAPGDEQIVAQAGAALRTEPMGAWQTMGAAAPELGDGYLELASSGRAAVSIDLPELGSVELPAVDGWDGAVIVFHITLNRSGGGAARVRMLRGDALARLATGDVPLPEGCNVLLETGHGPDLEAAVVLPKAHSGDPRPLQVDASPAPPPPGPGQLTGRITRADDGRPVPDARLILVQTDITSAGPRQFVHEVQDGEGKFDWSDLPRGRFHLFVQAEGFAADITRHITIDSTLVLPPLDIRLDVGRTINGRVVDASGAPVAGALVLSDSDAPAMLLGLIDPTLTGQFLPMARTDYDGLFEFTHLRKGVQVLRATHAGWGPGFGEVAADAAEVEVRLPQGGAVAGEVRRDDGTLWPGAQLIASFTNPLPTGRCMSFGYGITGEQGLYRIDDLPAEQGVVLLLGAPEAERHMPPMESVAVPAGGTAPVNFGAPVPAGHDGTLVGYLSEVDGSPAAGRMMSVMSQSWERTGHFETSMVDEHGDWRIEKLPADTYQVYVVFDVQFGVVTRVGQVDVPDHGEAHFATQLPSGRLAGHVLSPDGTPLAGTDLVILERQAMGTWEFIAHIVADDAGAWACEALGPGLYRPMAFDRTGVLAAARGDPVLLGTGEVSGLNVQLTQGGTLTVRVAGADGAPMAGATVQLHDARGDSWEFVQFQLTGDDGTLRLPGVPAGIWDVQAETSAGGSGRTTVEVRAGEPARADLVLPR